MKSCHTTGPLFEAEGLKRLVLAGNPNTGKSVFFHRLTGIYVDVSNYPGTTLEVARGRFRDYLVLDTPGVYGLGSFNDEERITKEIVATADVILNVVSALHLERDLFLTQQLIDTGKPVLVALNMVDEAEKAGVIIDVRRLSELLGVPVVPTVAISGQGWNQLIAALPEARIGKPTLELVHQSPLDQTTNSSEQNNIIQVNTFDGDLCFYQRQHVNWIYQQTVRIKRRNQLWRQRLGHWLVHPLTGLPLLAVVLFTIYKLIGVYVAGELVGFTEETLMQGYYQPFITAVIERLVPLNSTAGIILAGEFGLLTMTVTYLLGLLLPLVTAFYFFLSLLEDTGYLPRIAALTDRMLTAVGLNGRGIIPLILGFGCVTMATITTRLLGSDRERRIAIILLGLTIPCSAQLGVIAGMLAGLGWPYLLFYIGVIFTVFAVTGTMLNAFLPGKSTWLFIDLPPLRWPRWRNVCHKTAVKSWHFIKEAFPLFAAGALIISFLQLTGSLEFIQQMLTPLTVGWLGLPPETATAFIMGIVRRDFGAAGLTSLELTPWQTLTALIVITLFVPCIASILVLFKERSRGEAMLIWLSSWVVAFLVGGLCYRVEKFLGSLPAEKMVPLFILVLSLIISTTVALVKMLGQLTCHKKGSEQCAERAKA